jgi:hypothetical protein
LSCCCRVSSGASTPDGPPAGGAQPALCLETALGLPDSTPGADPFRIHDPLNSWHTHRMRRRLDRMTVAQAQAIQAYSPGAWQLCETPEGWIAKRGEAVLVATNGGHTRLFASADTAIRRLQAEIGVSQFHVEALSA